MTARAASYPCYGGGGAKAPNHHCGGLVLSPYASDMDIYAHAQRHRGDLEMAGSGSEGGKDW